jgi:hypothetical protein
VVSELYIEGLWCDGEVHARFEDDDFEIEFIRRGDVYIMCALSTPCTSHNMLL